MAMFDKHKSSRQAPEREEKPAVARPAPEQPAPATAGASGGSARVAMIGQGIGITGDVAAKSDLKVEGRIEGRSVTSSHDVEVAESGVIKASISARVIKVAGAVAGDITGSEKVLITKSGRVQGNIVAPRVQLDDGALFRGSIDMNPAEPANAKKAEPANKAEPVKAATESAAKPGPGAATSAKTAVGGAGKEPGLTLKSG